MGASESTIKNFDITPYCTFFPDYQDRPDNDTLRRAFLTLEGNQFEYEATLPRTKIEKLRESDIRQIYALLTHLLDTLEFINKQHWKDLVDSYQQFDNLSIHTLHFLARILTIINYELDKGEVKFMFWTTYPYLDNRNYDPNEDITQRKDSIKETLGYKIMENLMRLLFLDGLCIPVSNPTEEEAPTMELFTGGLKRLHRSSFNISKNAERIQTEIFKNFSCLLSEILFYEIYEVYNKRSIWNAIFVSGELPFTHNLFYSFLNATLNYSNHSNALALLNGFGSNYGNELFVKSGLDIFLMAIDLKYKEDDTQPLDGQKNLMYFHCTGNVYKKLLSEIINIKDFQFILNGFLYQFQGVCNHRKSIFNQSLANPVPFYKQLLLLFWQLINCNNEFVKFISNNKEMALDLVYYLLYFLYYNSSNDFENVTLFSIDKTVSQICAYTLCILTSERKFAVQLNESFQDNIFSELPTFNGTYLDFLMLVAHRTIIKDLSQPSTQNTNRKDPILLNTILCFVANIAPYKKHSIPELSSRYLELFKYFSRPSWLSKRSTNFISVITLCEIFDYFIHYNYEGHISLIHSIIHDRLLFYNLKNLKFENFDEFVEKKKKKISNENFNNEAADEFEKLMKFYSLNDTQFLHTDYQNKEEIKEDWLDKWVPSEDWFNRWKSKINLDTVMKLLDYVIPLIEDESAYRENFDHQQVSQFLSRLTLVGLLPPPPTLTQRNFKFDHKTNILLTSVMWIQFLEDTNTTIRLNWKYFKLVSVEQNAFE